MSSLRITFISIPFLVAAPAMALSGSDARSVAMAGTGVASASYLTAPFYNPAQLTNHVGSDDFGSLLPSVTLGANDEEDLFGKIKAFQAADRAWREDQTNVVKGLNRRAKLLEVGTGHVDVSASLGFAVAVPNDFLPINAYSKTTAVSRIEASVAPEDFFGTQPLKSYVHAVSGATVEFGLAMAHAFTLPYRDYVFSVGLTPKVQQLAVHNAKETLDAFEDDKYQIPSDYQSASVFNADMGMSYKPSQFVTVGFVVQNVISHELKSHTSKGVQVTYLVEPDYNVGIAFDNHWLLLSADLDINETRQFKEFEPEGRELKLGAEVNAWDWAQFRGGYTMNVSGEEELSQYSAGIGFTPFGAVGVDLGVQYQSERDLAVSAQFLMTF
ncbi:conjugal transfer protein TraF [Veronia nyctiphanis]|nr:conjugal transfer protein TraF [Veronia nyctiphanis]